MPIKHEIKIKIILTVSNFSSFIAIYKSFCICRFKELYLGKQSQLLQFQPTNALNFIKIQQHYNCREHFGMRQSCRKLLSV